MIPEIRVDLQGGRYDMIVSPTLGDRVGAVFFISEIEGLGPISAEIKTAKSGLLPGRRYNGKTYGMRRIVFHYQTKYSGRRVADAREKIRQAFQPGQVTRYLCKNAGKTVSIYGYTESVDHVVFTDEPEEVVTVLCLQPWFEETMATVFTREILTGATVIGTENGGAEAWPVLRLNLTIARQSVKRLDVTVSQDAETSREFSLIGINKHLTGAPNESAVITINSAPGKRYATMEVNGGPSISLLDFIDSAKADWGAFTMFYQNDIVVEITAKSDYGITGSASILIRKTWNEVIM